MSIGPKKRTTQLRSHRWHRWAMRVGNLTPPLSTFAWHNSPIWVFGGHMLRPMPDPENLVAQREGVLIKPQFILSRGAAHLARH